MSTKCNLNRIMWSCLSTLGYSRLSSSTSNERLCLIQDPNENVIDKTVSIHYKDSDTFYFQVVSKVGKDHKAYTSPRNYSLNSLLRCYHDIAIELSGKPAKDFPEIFIEKNRMQDSVLN